MQAITLSSRETPPFATSGAAIGPSTDIQTPPAFHDKSRILPLLCTLVAVFSEVSDRRSVFQSRVPKVSILRPGIRMH